MPALKLGWDDFPVLSCWSPAPTAHSPLGGQSGLWKLKLFPVTWCCKSLAVTSHCCQKTIQRRGAFWSLLKPSSPSFIVLQPCGPFFCFSPAQASSPHPGLCTSSLFLENAYPCIFAWLTLSYLKSPPQRAISNHFILCSLYIPWFDFINSITLIMIRHYCGIFFSFLLSFYPN